MPDERAARFRAFVELRLHGSAQRADVVASYCDQRNLEGAAGSERAHCRQDHLARQVAGHAEHDERIGPRFDHLVREGPLSSSRRLGALNPRLVPPPRCGVQPMPQGYWPSLTEKTSMGCALPRNVTGPSASSATLPRSPARVAPSIRIERSAILVCPSRREARLTVSPMHV